jgi:ubiquinone/menaquinone biosynthesis C-methylase UbiE
MKIRESGMPEKEMWHKFFDPDRILSLLALPFKASSVVDFGCGYGTFTIPAAKRVQGVVPAIDIEPLMLEQAEKKATLLKLTNIRFHLRDFVSDGTGLADSRADYVMLFNILHAEDPKRLLHEAYRILASGGRTGVMHRNHDPDTPRGPSLENHPRPEDCGRWMTEENFRIATAFVDLPPYHFGIIGQKE